MINPKVVKAILDFYLQSRGITDLPTDDKSFKKISYICSVNNSAEKHFDQKEKLLQLCVSLAEQEAIEDTNHHSNKLGPVSRAMSDFAFMACALRAVRSYILHTIHAEKLLTAKEEDVALLNLANYHKSDLAFYNNKEYGFLDVIRYEAKSEDFKHVKTFNDFYNIYCPPGKKKDKKDETPFPTLEKLTEQWRKKVLIDLTSAPSVTQFSAIGNKETKEKKTGTDKKAERHEKHLAHEAAEAERLKAITGARPGQ